MSWRFYAVIAAWDVVTVVIMQVYFIETKGKTLEEINDIFEPLPVTEGEGRSERDSLSADGTGNVMFMGKTSLEKA